MRREGGCLCGSVRYAVSGEPAAVALCHCKDCRRATGAPLVAWAIYPRGSYELLRGQPAQHASSPGVARGFCPRCGTQLSWEGDVLPGMIDITLASLDDPAALTPAMHLWETQRLPWLELADSLPRHAGFPPSPPD